MKIVYSYYVMDLLHLVSYLHDLYLLMIYSIDFF